MRSIVSGVGLCARSSGSVGATKSRARRSCDGSRSSSAFPSRSGALAISAPRESKA